MCAVIATKTCQTCGIEKPVCSFKKGKYIGGRWSKCNRCALSKNRREWERAYNKRLLETRTGYEPRICANCEQTFWFKTVLGNRSNRRSGVYCSVHCRDEYRRRKIICATCGVAFTVWRCAEDERKYCSQKCAGTAYSRRSFTCEQCGCESEPLMQSIANERRYCSKKCEGLARRKHIRGRKPYGSAAWRELRDSIIVRDGGACKSCGDTDDLLVHHKVRWRAGGPDDPSNLVTLCRACHAVVHCQSGDIPAYFALRR